MRLFADREEAGRELASELRAHAGADAVVLGLPRGGIPVAAAVAAQLEAPLDAFVVRKVGVPGHGELAMGAVASGGVVVRNEPVIESLGIDDNVFEAVAAREQARLAALEALRGGADPPDIAGRTVIVVDDGLATGATMRAAITALRGLGAGKVIAAVPVGPQETCAALADEADAVVCPHTPAPFGAVGSFYERFDPVSDEQVRELLARDGSARSGAGAR